MPRSTRLSIGGGVSLSTSSRYNLRSASAPRSRRISLGNLPSQNNENETDKLDRRAKLEEWRKQVRNRDKPPVLSSSSMKIDTNKENNNPGFIGMSSEITKRARTADSLPRIPRVPPTNLNKTPSDGTTALERFRMRRNQQQLQSQPDRHENDSLPPSQPSQPSSNQSSPSQDDNTISFSSRVTTPKLSIAASSRTTRSSSKRRSLSMGAGPRRRTRSSFSPADFPEPDCLPSPQKCQKSESPTSTEDVSVIEEAGLRSRIQEMQQRITQLEREKLDLTKSKAPLEARFRQKEDSWTRERKRLHQEIDQLHTTNKEVDEQFRALELKNSALEEERNKLKYEALKASVNSKQEKAQHHDPASDVSKTWSRQLQNDRDVAELRISLREAEDEIGALRLDKVSLEADLDATQRQLYALQTSHDELLSEYDDNEHANTKVQEAEIQLQVLTTEHMATAAQLHAVCADLAQTKSSAEAQLEATKQEWKDEVAKMKFEISVLKNSRVAINNDENLTQTFGSGTMENNEAILKARIEERDARISELEAQLAKGEELRRVMHNRIQELRGNIRVFVRTRPFLPGDGDGHESSIDVQPDEEGLSIADSKKQSRHHFSFDRVFPPSAGQDHVFKEVSDFVQSALDGYNVCLFSYGQTGSGKTHTMQGTGNGVMRGIIPRAVEKILSQSAVLRNRKWKFQMSASFLEIYNEMLRDLLVINPKTSLKKEAKLSIKRNAEGKSYVDGLSKIPIDTENSEKGMEQLEKLMACAARSRSVGKTNMNAHSSRSHSVFMLHLQGYNEDSGTVVDGSLNLCDLAGSERLDRSGAGSDIKRLKETQAINKSLSCLADVFNSLANGSSHVPFRNSKLTYLLQDCLSGDGKALMFVNLSPTIASSSESLCSLRFAQRVNQVELGKPIKHVQYSTK